MLTKTLAIVSIGLFSMLAFVTPASADDESGHPYHHRHHRHHHHHTSEDRHHDDAGR